MAPSASEVDYRETDRIFGSRRVDSAPSLQYRKQTWQLNTELSLRSTGTSTSSGPGPSVLSETNLTPTAPPAPPGSADELESQVLTARVW